MRAPRDSVRAPQSSPQPSSPRVRPRITVTASETKASLAAETRLNPGKYVMLSSRGRGGRPHDAPFSSPTPCHMDDNDDAGARGRVLEWELGLPAPAELTPVSHPLIPPALAAAFGIKISSASPSLIDSPLAHDSPNSHLSFRCDEDDDDEGDGEIEDAAAEGGVCRGRSVGKKARMVWTPELHHRFVEAVALLGNKGAVPKAIVRLMNVEGLTRENVASHLQKYRLYLKRTRTAATSTPPPAYISPFRSQPARYSPNRSGYCAFLSRDSEKPERD